MRRRALVPALAALALGGAALLDGGEVFARLALRIGAPGLAERLTDDPALRGLALSARGRHGAAAAAFGAAGVGQDYNRATALARAGDYAGALLAYDALLARDPDHADARANFALLIALHGGTELQLAFADVLAEERDGPTLAAPEGQGGGRATGDGAQADGGATDIFAPKVNTASGVRRVPKIFDDVFIAASDEWLATLLDQPGRFLAARLAAESRRRRETGSGVPEGEDEW